MAFTTDNVYEAIGRAAMMAERVEGRYVVASFRGRWRALRACPHIPRERIVWRSWKSKRQAMVVKDTEANRHLAATMDRSDAAKVIGVNVWQFDYAARIYGWKLKPYGVQIDVDKLREAMKVMTARAYAKTIGVHDTRIYTLCRVHKIPRPIRGKRGN